MGALEHGTDGLHRMRPVLLLLSPFVVLGAWGAVHIASPEASANLFPYFWLANEIALFAAALGLVLLIFRGPGPEGPTIDEWASVRPRLETAGNEGSLESLLRELARGAESESARLR